MWSLQRFSVRLASLFAIVASLLTVVGCGPNFRQLRFEGQQAMTAQDYVLAQDRFEQAARKQPAHPGNLYDLGTVHLARAKHCMDTGARAAALRAADRAVNCFSRAVESHPGMHMALAAKNEALELKGRFEDALGTAEWATTFVGPRAREQIFLARELEERGDYDAALLRYRQAVAMERDSAMAHAALGEFLLRQDNQAMAVRHLKTAYKLNPMEPGVAQRLTSLNEPLPRTVEPPAPSP